MNKFIIALVLCLSTNHVLGAEKAQPPQNPFTPQGAELPDVVLSADSVRKVIASFGPLREEFQDFAPSGDGGDMQHYMKSNEAAFKKGEAIVREAGFKDWADWGAHFAKVMRTYMAYNMQRSSKVSQAQLENQMRAVQGNPNLSPEQKKAALDMMGMATMYNEMAAGVPEKDLKTLEPFIGQLEQTLKAGEK